MYMSLHSLASFSSSALLRIEFQTNFEARGMRAILMSQPRAREIYVQMELGVRIRTAEHGPGIAKRRDDERYFLAGCDDYTNSKDGTGRGGLSCQCSHAQNMEADYRGEDDVQAHAK
jgi:hypothetical protein